MLTTTTVTGTTSHGRPATVTVLVDEPDPAWQVFPPPLVIGNTVNVADFSRIGSAGTLGGARFTRTFSPKGKGFMPATNPRRQVPAGVAEFHSVADWLGDDTMVDGVRTLLDDLPDHLFTGPPLLPELRPCDPDGYTPDSAPVSDGLSWLLTWCHEYEHKMISAGVPVRELRRRHRLLYRTVREHPRGYRVGYMAVQNLYWTMATTRPDAIKGDGDIFAWWAGVGDFAAVDAYVPSVIDRPAAVDQYPAPEVFLRACWELAAGTGRRLLLPEVGVILQGDPPDVGNYRAAWIRRLVAALAAGGAAGAAWWDATGAEGRDFRLSDPLSREAWAQAIAGRH